MRRRVMKAQIKGGCASPLDVLDRLVRQQVGEIAETVDWRQVLPQICGSTRSAAARRVGGFVGEVIGRAAQHAEELIVPVLVRAELRLPSKMPFPDECGVVPTRFQQRRYRWMVRR